MYDVVDDLESGCLTDVTVGTENNFDSLAVPIEILGRVRVYISRANLCVDWRCFEMNRLQLG